MTCLSIDVLDELVVDVLNSLISTNTIAYVIFDVGDDTDGELENADKVN